MTSAESYRSKGATMPMRRRRFLRGELPPSVRATTRACQRTLVATLPLVLGWGCTAASKPTDRVPVEVVEAPVGAEPEFMNLAVQPFPDADRDGWPDVVPVLVHLFARDSAQPRAFDGGFEFSVLDLNQNLIQRWAVNPIDAPRAAAVRGGLTGYSFRLDLPRSENGSLFPDRVHVEAAFIPMSGGPTIARRVLIPFRLN